MQLAAEAIARQCGIVTSEKVLRYDDLDSIELPVYDTHADTDARAQNALSLSGPDMMKFSKADWEQVCRFDEIVFSHTTTEQKLGIVNEFQAGDECVDMTGDGVNDAPSLKQAVIGIAMGRWFCSETKGRRMPARVCRYGLARELQLNRRCSSLRSSRSCQPRQDDRLAFACRFHRRVVSCLDQLLLRVASDSQQLADDLRLRSQRGHLFTQLGPRTARSRLVEAQTSFGQERSIGRVEALAACLPFRWYPAYYHQLCHGILVDVQGGDQVEGHVVDLRSWSSRDNQPRILERDPEPSQRSLFLQLGHSAMVQPSRLANTAVATRIMLAQACDRVQSRIVSVVCKRSAGR